MRNISTTFWFKIGHIVALIPVAAIGLFGCAKPTASLEAMSDQALYEEIHRAKFQVIGTDAYYHRVRKILLKKHPEWPIDVRQAIEDEQVILGMTKLQAAASWGTPTAFRQTSYRGRAVETWIFGVVPGEGPLPTLATGSDRNRFLYFEGDRLVGYHH